MSKSHKSNLTDMPVSMNNETTTTMFRNILKHRVEAVKTNPSVAAKLRPLMVWGAPGIGKSSIITSVAKEYDIPVRDIRLSEMEPIDLRGIPVPNHENKNTEWFVTSELPTEKDGEFGILLFDELSAADRSLQTAAYRILLDRNLGNLYSVPKGWIIIGAGNREQDKAIATTMSSALANRMCHIELISSAPEWVEWGSRNNIHPSVIGYINFAPQHLFYTEDQKLSRGYPTPRSWEAVSDLLFMYGHNNIEELRHQVFGNIGTSVGVQFMAFYSLDERFDNVLETMLNPKSEIKIPAEDEPDKSYALCACINYLLWRGVDEKDQQLRIDGMFRYAMAFSPDFSSLLIYYAMHGIDENKAHYYFRMLRQHPRYKEWREKNYDQFKQQYQSRQSYNG